MCGAKIAAPGSPGGPIAPPVAPRAAPIERTPILGTPQPPVGSAGPVAAPLSPPTAGAPATAPAPTAAPARGHGTSAWAYHEGGGQDSGSGGTLSSLTLGGLGIRSNRGAWVLLIGSALFLVGGGAAAMYFFMRPQGGTAGPTVAPQIQPDAGAAPDLVEVGTPIPSGIEPPSGDFVAGGAREAHSERETLIEAGQSTGSTADSHHGGGTSGTSTPGSGGAAGGGRDAGSHASHGTGGTSTSAAPDAGASQGGTHTQDPIENTVPEEGDLELELYGARVRYVIRRYYAARAQGCFDHATRNNVQLRGTVVVGFTIAADGQVSAARPTRNTTGDSALGTCLANQVRTWRLPAPGESLEFEMPFSR